MSKENEQKKSEIWQLRQKKIAGEPLSNTEKKKLLVHQFDLADSDIENLKAIAEGKFIEEDHNDGYLEWLWATHRTLNQEDIEVLFDEHA